MAHEEGWPLGLGALNVRAGVLRGLDLSGSASFSTDFTSSSRCASSLPSTDFDTESAWSLARGGGGMTLASLIGLVDAIESRRRPSARASRSGKLRALLLSLSASEATWGTGVQRRRSASSSRWRGEPVVQAAVSTGSEL